MLTDVPTLRPSYPRAHKSTKIKNMLFLFHPLPSLPDQQLIWERTTEAGLRGAGKMHAKNPQGTTDRELIPLEIIDSNTILCSNTFESKRNVQLRVNCCFDPLPDKP